MSFLTNVDNITIKTSSVWNESDDIGIYVNKNLFNGVIDRILYQLFPLFMVRKLTDRAQKNFNKKVTILAAYPTADTPLFLYNIGGEAERYCEKKIMSDNANIFKRTAHKLLKLIRGIPFDVNEFIILVEPTKLGYLRNLVTKEAGVNCHDMVCISSSNKVYLFFSNKQYPAFVIHNETHEQFQLKSEIYSFTQEHTPKPIKQFLYDDNLLTLEEGLSGQPWFQLLNNKNTSLVDIRNKSYNKLQKFHELIGENIKWNKTISLYKELSYQIIESQQYVDFGPKTINQCIECNLSIKNSEALTCIPQHGDFCIDNLIFDTKKTYVIDFEDFGNTHMPFQDNFSLALSLFKLRKSQNKEELKKELLDCCQYIDVKDKNILSALFVYHLLFRMGDWSNSPEREKTRSWNHMVLLIFLEHKNDFF